MAVHRFSDARMYILIMEFCAGGELLAVLRKHTDEHARTGDPYSPPKEADAWRAQIFLGLEHLHLRTSLMLRDLKPDNVVIDGHGVAKLTDFGFGKAGVLAHGWSFGHPLGTPGYIAPEMLISTGEHSHKADLYSFGVLIWVTLSGGCIGIARPRPPTNWLTKRTGPVDYGAMSEDFELLRDQVQRGGKGPICEDAEELVLLLINPLPAARPDHGNIREAAYMQRQRLPSYEDGPSKVVDWLFKMLASETE
jgi:serine/threonine protein kinase